MTARSRTLVENPTLRRLELSSLLWNAAEQVYLVGLLVLAYRSRGSLGVAAVGILQAVPMVVLLPLVLRATSGVRTDRVLRGLVAVRAVAIGVAAFLAMTGAPFEAILACASLDALAGAAARPARSLLIPGIARSTRELVSANVSISAGRSLAGLVGPAIAAVLIAGPGGTAALWLGAALFTGAALVTVGVRGAASLVGDASERTRASHRGARDGPVGARGGRRKPAGDRGSALRRLGRPRLVVGLVVSEQLVRGMLPVLLVGLALGQLQAGDEAVGILNSSIGLGGLIGGVVSIALVRRARIAPGFVAAVALWGAGVAVPGLAPAILPAVAGLALAGVGRSIAEVSAVTLLQRTVPVADRPEVFGLLESLAAGALAAGALIGALLVAGVGAAEAMIVAGCLPIALALFSWRALRSADDSIVVPEAEIELLRRAPMLRPLALSTIEELASDMRRISLPAGQTVVEQGQHGDAFYVIESGTFDVSVDGAEVRQLGPGDSFGEIALLRDTERTATVRTRTAAVLAALDREPFLAAVLGRHDAVAAAQDVIRGHLGG